MTCLVKSAEAARAPLPGEATFTTWQVCSTCKQRFTGLVRLRLAIVLWANYARKAETNKNLLAAEVCSAALDDAGELAEAARLQRGMRDTRTRVWGPECREVLNSACNLASLLLELGVCVEAAVLLRTTLAVHTRTVGPDNESTLVTASHLSSVLLNLGEYAEAEILGQGTLQKMRRVLGRDHPQTLATAANLASSFSGQGNHTGAV